jgi:hypothetical protein
MLELKPVFFLLLLGVVAMSSFQCRDRLGAGFDMNFQRDFEIQAGSPPNTVLVFPIEYVPSDTQAYFTAHKVTADDIARVRAVRGQAVGLFSDTGFGFVDLLSVWLVDPFNPDNRKEIFYREFDIPLNQGNNLTLLAGLADVRQIVLGGLFHIEVVMRLRDPAPAAIPIRIIFDLRAEVE